MKIKDIVIREDGVTVAAISGDKAKLSTGQEIDAKTLTPDPQHPGQFKMPAMDPNAIKPGAVVSSDATTSEDYEEEGHHDTVASGNHPVGGDSSDDFINDVRDKDYERAQRLHSMLRGAKGEMSRIRHLAGLKEDDTTQAQPTPDELDARLTPAQKTQQDKSLAAMTQATAGMDDKKDDIMGAGMDAMIKTLPPEEQSAAKEVFVYNPDGTVDGDETMYKMTDSFANIISQLYQGFAELVSKIEKLVQSKDPEFTKLPPEQQQQIIKDVAEMKAYLPKMQAELAKSQATWDKEKVGFRQQIDQRANDRFKAKTGLDMVRGGAGQKTNIGFDPNNPGGPGAANGSFGESADDRLLKQMLSIAGLR